MSIGVQNFCSDYIKNNIRKYVSVNADVTVFNKTYFLTAFLFSISATISL